MTIVKKTRFYISISFVLCFLLFCSTYSQIEKDSSFFPLAIGNRWIYESTDLAFIDTMTIVDTQRVNGKLYYAFIEGIHNNSFYTWFRKDSNKVYIVDTVTAAAQIDTSNLREYLVYDFSANVGESWNLPLTNNYFPEVYCDYGGTIYLENKNDSVVTTAGKFKNCFFFLHDNPCRDAGRPQEWFGAGIGRIAFWEDGRSDVYYSLTYSNITTGVSDHGNSHAINTYKLLQNYPNPFNPTTNIVFELPEGCSVEVNIYDALGRKIRTLVDSYLKSGTHSVVWDASSQTSGTYFCKIQTKDFTQTIKLDLVR